MQLETHEAQRIGCQSAVGSIVVKEVTRTGRLQNYYAKLNQRSGALASSLHVAQTSGDALVVPGVQAAAMWRGGSGASDLARDRLQSVAPQKIITQFSSGPQDCGLDGLVFGTTSKAGGTSVVQIQLNQNTEQHRCNAV